MRVVLFIGLFLCFCFNSHGEYSRIEQNTIKSGFTSLQWIQFLHAISKKCNDYEYAELSPRAELEELVASRLLISLEKLEILAEEDEGFITGLFKAINNVECNKINVNQYLSDIYDKYDVAKFDLELYDPISYPLMTEREIAQLDKSSLAEYISKKSKEAETIVLAELIPLEDAPKGYQDHYKSVAYKPEYIYQIIKGWKKSLPFQYMTPPISFNTLASDDRYKDVIKKNGKTTVLIFIKNPEYSFTKSTFIGSVNLDLYNVDITFLKSIDWEWVGKTLID